MAAGRLNSGNTAQRELKQSACPTVIRWQPRHLYRSLLHLFGEQCRNQVRPAVPPFTPPLTEREFTIARKMYVSARVSQFLMRYRAKRKDTAPNNRFAERWPTLPLDWKIERALGTLFFANSKREQQKARQQVKHLAEHGPMSYRTALKVARKATPQARAAFSGREILLKAGPRLAELEFVWGFLRGEAAAYMGRSDRTGRSKAAAALSKCYPFLNLTADQIAVGLSSKNHVERQFSGEAGISTASVRTLLR